MENKAQAQTKAQQVEAEQIHADEMEGYRRAPEEIYALVLEHREIVKKMAPLEAEKKAIEELIKEYQIKEGVVHLTHDGVDLTTLSETTRNNFDKDAASQKLGVDVLAQFYSTSSSFRLIIKK